MMSRDDDAARRSAGGVGDGKYRGILVPTIVSGLAPQRSITLMKIVKERDGRDDSDPHPLADRFSFWVLSEPLAASEIRSNGRRVMLDSGSPGSAFVFDLRDEIAVRYHGRCSALKLEMTQDAVREIAKANDLKWNGAFSRHYGGVDPILHRSLSVLKPYFLNSVVQNQLVIDHVILAAHAHLVLHYADVQSVATPLARGGLTVRQERRAIEIIEGDLSGKLSIADLAAGCGLSPGYFGKAFQRSLGVSPHVYQRAIRIGLAKDLLRGREHSLAEICGRCGFYDASHFNRVFLRCVGMTPGAWRRANR